MNGNGSGFDEDLLADGPPAGAVSLTAHPGARYDFGVAYPDPDSLPLQQLVECLGEELQREGRSLARYPHPLGYPPLREWLAARLAAKRGFSVDAVTLSRRAVGLPWGPSRTPGARNAGAPTRVPLPTRNERRLPSLWECGWRRPACMRRAWLPHSLRELLPETGNHCRQDCGIPIYQTAGANIQG